MRSIHLWTTLLTLALAAPVFAQSAPPPPGPSGSGSSGLGGWPEAVSDRPFNVNGGMLEVHGSLPIFTLATGGGMSDTLVLGGGGVAFGLSDQLEIGGDYAFQVSPKADVAGVLAGHMQIRLHHDAKLSAALGGAIGYSDSVNGFALAGGLALRYRLSPQLSIYSSSSGLPICGGCLHVLGPVTGQVVIGVPNSGGSAVLVNLPVGLGLQVSPQLYLFGETSVATLFLSPSNFSLAEFSDYIGVNAGGWLTVDKHLEIGGSFADDLKHPGDVYLVEVLGRIFL
jgi:hypothetical protein